MADNPEPSAEALEAACSAIASMEDEPLQWRIARAIDAAVAKERERCAAIISAARFGDVDRDWRSLGNMIEGGQSLVPPEILNLSGAKL